jgi:hypothetical protein
MKKSPLLATVVLTLVYTVALIAQLSSHFSIDLLSAPVIIGGVVAFGLLLLALGDYSRKPHFCGRRAPDTTPRTSTPATSPDAGVACDWTYTTRSA